MKKRFVIAVALSWAPFALFAETVENNSRDAVIVTATKTAQTAFESLASVTVITREDINRLQPQELSDLLSRYAGIDVKQTGGPGSLTSVFMRGTESDHTLVLIDGVRASSATGGAFAWYSMPVSQIERIEIVRGPRANLYGSDAIGGVIQIFTRKNQGVSAVIETGSYGTRGAQAGWGYRKNSSRFSIHLSTKDIEGFSAQNENGSSFDPDKDGQKINSITLYGAVALPAKQTLELNVWHADAETEYDQGVQDSLNQAGSLVLKGNLSGIWSHSLRVGYAVDDISTDEQFFPAEFITHRNTADWQHDLTIGSNNLITLGINYLSEDGKNTDTLTNTVQYDEAVTNKAAYLNWLTSIVDTDIQLSGRTDNHETYGKHSSGHISVGHNIFPTARIWAAYGSAFRAPNFNDLYYPGCCGGLFAGNPDLEPEQSVTTELGLKLSPSPQQRLELTLFHTRTEDLIANQGVNFKAVNIAEASSRGIEAVYQVQTDNWQIQSSMTAKTSRNDTDKSELLNRPDQKASFSIDRHFGNASVGTDIQFVSDHADIDSMGSNIRLPGYGLANLRYALSVTKQLRLEVKAVNVTDKEYETVAGYNTPGRSYYLTLRYR